MGERFEHVEFAAIEDAVREHLTSLPSAIESFLEEHILTSNHYRIDVDGEAAGFASIHGGSLITQFSLQARFGREGQRIFRELRQMEQVQSAFVPTCDEFYLAHALDDYRQVAKQAYFFASATDQAETVATEHFSLRLATLGDAAFVRAQTGDFFDPVEKYVEAKGLFLTLRRDEPVGFGVMEVSALLEDVASIGMFTIERFRGAGVGTATIALLKEECRRRGKRAVAGCWYYNHFSKRTLERAGMYSPTRLLKVEY